MKVADSTLLIGHARADPDAKAFLEANTTETLVASVLTVQELAVGEILARDESKERILRQFGPFDVQAFTADHAYYAATIEAALREDGEYEPALKADVLIGGVARSLSVPVVTKNVDHYERFDGVRVEGY